VKDRILIIGWLMTLVFTACAQPARTPSKRNPMENPTVKNNPTLPSTELATLANG